MVINPVHKIIKKGVTVQNRNPLNYLWWRRGDLNSRPPPCEGDALPAELLPHMDAATRRSVVCMPFMCRGQVFFAGGTSGGRGHGRRDGKSRTAVGPGASRGKAAACPPASGRSGEARRLPEKGEEAPGTRQGAARATCRARGARRFPWSALLWMRAVSMPGRPRNGNAAPGPPGRQRPHGPERRAAFPGSPSSGHALQKNRPGRPCRAWLPRKKTL